MISKAAKVCKIFPKVFRLFRVNRLSPFLEMAEKVGANKNFCDHSLVMKLESDFDLFADDDIRIKKTRIGIESVLYEYIYREQTAEQIAGRFPSLKLEQIYATILYNLHSRERVETYLLDWLSFSRKMREERAENPPPVILRLR